MASELEEVEWQFDTADHGAVRRLLEEPASWAGEASVTPTGPPATFVDRYLDTPDRRFFGAGYALRLREVEGRSEADATMKALVSTASDPGLRRRHEVVEPLAEATVEALLAAPGAVGTRVRAIAGPERPGTLVELRTRREAYALALPGQPPGEVALDETELGGVPEGARPLLLRVEVEVPAAAVDAYAAVVERFRAAAGLAPARLSKLEAGLRAAGVSLSNGAEGSATGG